MIAKQVRGLSGLRRALRPGVKNQALNPGLYHFRESRLGLKTRLHLRIDPDGCGTLVINASSILHLNSSAAIIAYYHLTGLTADQIREQVEGVFENPPQQTIQDIQLITGDLDSFIGADGKPVQTFSGVEINTPFSHHPSAPYRMDLALTYRCNNDCSHCYNARLRSYPELSTAEWIKIINRLWDLNIPHLIFTGGEPTLRDDLPELIAHAETLGQITGLNTNARRFSDPAYVEKLVQAGLDHVQITLESHDPAVHDEMVQRKGAWVQTVAGLQNALDSSLFVMTNTTMLKNNQAGLPETLDFLIETGVPTIGLNALIMSGRGKDVGSGLSEDELKPLLTAAQAKTAESGVRLIWYTPTLYCHFNPLEMGLGVKGCTAALYNMCLEPDGGVIPCQSYYHQLGHILKDSWKSIWDHELALELRQRSSLPDACQLCSLLEECGGGCPLSYNDQPRLARPVIPHPG